MSAFDSLITMDPYGLDGATVVWKSLDALEAPDGPKVNHTSDPPEQVARCQTCPIPPEEARCGAKCWYRLGMDDPNQKKEPPKPKPPKEQQPPRGYDREALDRAMVHNYFPKDIAKELGISVWMVNRWIEWRYR